MSVIGELHASLDAMGIEQQAFVFAFLMSYPLTLGALLEARGRRIAGGVAAASVMGFALFTDPWIHAVLLIVLAVGAMGVFIGAVYLADQVSERIALRGMPMPLPQPSVESTLVSVPPPSRERVPIGGAVHLKT